MFGDRLKLARKKSGYSLRGLSDALDGHVTAPSPREIRAGRDDAEFRRPNSADQDTRRIP